MEATLKKNYNNFQNINFLFKCVYGDIPAVHPCILFVLCRAIGVLEPITVSQVIGRETVNLSFSSFIFPFINYN